MKFPNFPTNKNQTIIGVCAPSAGVGHKLESFDKSISTLTAHVGPVTEEGNVRVDALRPDTGANRGTAFNRLIENKDVSCIVSASGGEFCMDVLPYIDAELIKANPKWVCGASDPTSILYYITTGLDIATIYGFNAGSFDWEPLHEFQTNALSILSGNIVTQNSFDKYDGRRDFSATGVELQTDVEWKLYNCQEGKLDVTGRLIGGCSDVLSNIIGTPYDCTDDFLNRYSDEGIIWYLDPFEANPISFHLFLLKLKYAGYLRNAKAVIIGRIMFDGGYSDEDFAELIAEDLDCPFVLGADIGHVDPCMTLINGSTARIQVSEGRGRIEMELR